MIEQAMLAQFFISLIESACESEELDKVEEAANGMGFERLDKLRSIYDGHTVNGYEQRINRTVAEIVTKKTVKPESVSNRLMNLPFSRRLYGRKRILKDIMPGNSVT